MNTEKDKAQMDWQQVALNGGPPCFFVEGPQYCGRAERWPGHGNEAFHNFVSLDDLLATARKEAREAAFRDIRERVEATNPKLTFGSANGNVMKKCILMEISDLEGATHERTVENETT